jgi:hypothetical protein
VLNYLHHINNNSKQVIQMIDLEEEKKSKILNFVLGEILISNNMNNNNNNNHHYYHHEKPSNRPSKIKCRRQKHDGYNRYHSGR